MPLKLYWQCCIKTPSIQVIITQTASNLNHLSDFLDPPFLKYETRLPLHRLLDVAIAGTGYSYSSVSIMILVSHI